jgi:hypothetical protein
MIIIYVTTGVLDVYLSWFVVMLPHVSPQNSEHWRTQFCAWCMKKAFRTNYCYLFVV